MFIKFGAAIFKGVIENGNFERHIHHVQSIHSHPAGAIRLFQKNATGCAAPVKDPYIIETQKTTFKNIIAIDIFPVCPPRKIQHEFLEYFLQKGYIPTSLSFFFNPVDLHGTESMYR